MLNNLMVDLQCFPKRTLHQKRKCKSKVKMVFVLLRELSEMEEELHRKNDL